jgi:hypothetical protein
MFRSAIRIEGAMLPATLKRYAWLSIATAIATIAIDSQA